MVFGFSTDLGPQLLDGSFDREKLNNDRFHIGALAEQVDRQDRLGVFGDLLPGIR